MSRKEWFRIEASAGSGPTVVRIYDEIGGWFGVEAAELVRELDGLDVEELELRVNSPGGSVFDGLAIMNSLKAHKARVVAHVDGMAASAASLIVVGGADEVVMNAGTTLMIHNPSAATRGDAAAHRDSAARLDQIAGSIAAVYKAKAGGDVADWTAAMAAETWYTAQEAVDAGLADRLGAGAGEPVENRWDLSVFNYAGPRPAGKPNKERSGGMPTLLDNVRELLGLADGADDTAAAAAIGALRAERDELKAKVPPPGTKVVDEAALAEMKAQAQKGADALARLEQQDREQIVDAAIRAGKFPPARREHWLGLLKADPAGMTEHIAGMERDMFPVGEEIGNAAGGAESGDGDDGLYEQIFGKDA